MSVAAAVADLARRIGEVLKETGPTTRAPVSGITGTIRAEKIGHRTVHIYVNVAGSFPTGSTVIGYLPVGFEGGGGCGGARLWAPSEAAGVIEVISSGRVAIINPTTSTRSNANAVLTLTLPD